MMVPTEVQSDFVEWLIETQAEETRKMTEKMIENNWCDYHTMKAKNAATPN